MSKRNRTKNRQSLESSEKQLTRAKRIQSLKTLYFNRFMLVRYTAAACFFGNFYYSFMAWPNWMSWLSIALLILALPAFWQLGTMYGKRKVRFGAVRLYTVVQWLFNVLLLVSFWTLPMSQVMPFFSDTMMARMIASAFVLIGLVMLSLSLFRLQRIASNSDRVYKKIHFYEQKYNLSIDSI